MTTLGWFARFVSESLKKRLLLISLAVAAKLLAFALSNSPVSVRLPLPIPEAGYETIVRGPGFGMAFSFATAGTETTLRVGAAAATVARTTVREVKSANESSSVQK
jgi:hypothetical protein